MISQSAPLVADISSYQSDPTTLAHKLYANDVRGIMIKLTQGYQGDYAYENPLAAAQFRAWNHVMKKHGHKDPHIGFYNYVLGNGTENAKYFVAWLKAFGVDKDTAVSADMEVASSSSAQANEWLKVVRGAGFKNVSIYSMDSYFEGKLNPAAINTNNYWVASYGSTPPSLCRSTFYRSAWQFSDNYKGLCDMSLDYNHILIPKDTTDKRTDQAKKKKSQDKLMKKAYKDDKKPAEKSKADVKKQSITHEPKKPTYASSVGLFKSKYNLNFFYDYHLEHKTGQVLTKGNLFKGLPVEDNGVTRLLLPLKDLYVSANFDFVKQVSKE